VKEMLIKMKGYSLVALLLLLLFSKAVLVTAATSSCYNKAPCGTIGYQRPSVFHQHCCLIANHGKAIKLRQNNHLSLIFCPIGGSPQSVCESKGIFNDRSCSEILERSPNATSGYYDITLTNETIVSVYCDMEGSNCDGAGGWMRVGYFNMREPGSTCPPGLYTQTYNNQEFCDKSYSFSNGCSSMFYSSIGLNYTRVCGQVKGYQFGHPDSFINLQQFSITIDGAYSDGISITHGSNPRTHIWTYSAGKEENDTSLLACPCNTGYPGDPLPSFIGNDYYCESATDSVAVDTFYPNDTLWDGQQCNGLESPCCASSKMPWFLKVLNQSTLDDIEMRICSTESYPDEATPIELVEIYIKT
uniref:Fibrinogen C-terminal domain-containing protein n=1 Tax=Amphimedon queenslandica TaxID=400682 RepID=A0A1X7UPM3_AMPQE